MDFDPWTSDLYSPPPPTKDPYSPPGGRASHKKPGKRGGSGKRTMAMVTGALAIAIAASIGIAVERRDESSPAATAARLNFAAKTVTPPASWKLNFNASFTGDSLDTKIWDTCYPWGMSGAGCTNYGNNDEKEWYLTSQDQVSGGMLHLVAKREPISGVNKQGAPEEYACRSGMVTSYPGFKFEYGFVQITAKIPFGNGLWPALWLNPANLQWPPEIDILEHWNSDVQGKVYLHPTSGARQGGPVSTPNLSAGWHTFTLSWTKTQLTWYYDGNTVLTTTTGVPHQAMYIIMNVADTSTSSGTCNGTMEIKSVKVWQP
jgi:beta-glucanase (GH16 family)